MGLYAPSYAYFVHLLVSNLATHFSDNCCDLAPGERRLVQERNATTALGPQDITVRWH